ncbi:MAG: alternative ribosome rescue aminoacyl-tRNA hydrolase ArfB [Gammaproteobacteria bacterium]|nr:alternative ribosome rescue aminoacyl-tRNA hydrolase ArfB [Gammaproteobacteria bacterium]
MLSINNHIAIPDNEIEISAIRSQGAGGQNVNKVSSAIHLRFDIKASSLPDVYKQRLLALRDHRITKDGIVIIKAQQSRSQDKNREAALKRLQALIQKALVTPKKRKATKPSKASRAKRMDSKTNRGRAKDLRKKIQD